MSEVLFIKTSSLGDVIHHLPALTEAWRHDPGARFAWVVEEPFALLLRLHPASPHVITVAWRRWRRSLPSRATRAEIAAAFRDIRAQRYDAVIDSQGLLRSALMARAARGVRHGYGLSSIRERLASVFYDVRHDIRRDLHAVERNRLLTASALGYTVDGAPDFGLDRTRFRGQGARTAVLLHATARAEKEWPEAQWIALGRRLEADGFEIVLPWGTEPERQRAERIAAALPRASVPRRQPLDSVVRLIAGAELVVGVDTGLLHLAAALGVPLVAIFAGSRPHLTAPVGDGPMRVLGTHGAPPSVQEVETAVEAVRSE
jgi:heptosyltransferase-1